PLDDGPRLVVVDALPDRDEQPRRPAGSRLRVAVVERLQRHLALHQSFLEYVEYCADAVVAVGRDLDAGLAAPTDRRAGALEVEPLADLFGGLVQGVVDLLPIDLAHDVERRVRH